MGLVYRIQSKQDRTRGAYRPHIYGDRSPDVVIRLHREHHCRGDGHPSPEEDVGRQMEKDEHCGFNSAAGLLRWFKGFIPNLLQAGYEIVALHNVTITAVGEYQVLFTWSGESK